eukprot:TRINITY_DN203_c1_g1_i1.p1 TRINITY_DN203_c1_g1~~TRINITY_DN203_c1_g1_i1.p1  ORF type:complete len:301 (+),score=92.02 TRINITY_DN203_c1_g1_i1:131-1033(+)
MSDSTTPTQETTPTTVDSKDESSDTTTSPSPSSPTTTTPTPETTTTTTPSSTESPAASETETADKEKEEKKTPVAAAPYVAKKGGAGRTMEADEKKAAEEKKDADGTVATQTPAEFSVKHPLQDSWTWWYDNPKKKTNFNSWGDYLNKIYTFSSVEDFWSLWNNVKGANDLNSGSNYHLFKEGIEPKWEDPANARGGKWVLQIKTKKKTQINQFWLWSVLACIGASFDDDTQIVGVVVSIRKSMDKIALWTNDASDQAAVTRIGRQFKEILGVTMKLGYQAHADSLQYNSSFNNKNRYEV